MNDTERNDPGPTGSGTNKIDARIHDFLERLGDAAPPAPAFDDLRPGIAPNRSRVVPVAAAAALVAVGIAGIVTLDRDQRQPIDRAPATQPSAAQPTASAPETPPAAPQIVSSPTVADGPAGVDTIPGSQATTLLQTPLDRSALPLLDLPGWEITHAHSDEDLALYGGFEGAFVLVGDGPTYDAPLFTATVIDEPAPGEQSFVELLGMGDPIQIGDVTGSINVDGSDPDAGVDGAVTFGFVPLDDGSLVRFNSLRLSIDDVADLAATFVGARNDGSDVRVVPAGFREVPMPDDEAHSSLSVRFRSPTGAEIEINGENRGWVGLLGEIAGGVPVTRVIDGVEIADERESGVPGEYRVAWVQGDWSFYAMAEKFDSRDAFDAALSSILIVPSLDTASGVVTPDDRAQVVDALLVDISLPPGFDPAPLRNLAGARDRYQEITRVSGAVACGWLDVWFDAHESGDADAAGSAADALATSTAWPMLLEIDAQGGWSSAIWEYADAVNGGEGIPSGGGPMAPTRESAVSGLGCSFD